MKNCRIMYLRDKSGYPVGCVAMGLTRSMKKIKYQLSVLNPQDQFDRSLARHIALGRLLESPLEADYIGPLGIPSMKEVTFSVMKDMQEQHIDNSLAKIKAIFVKASDRLESLKPGEKITATGLANELATEFGLTGAGIYPTLKFLFDGYPDFDILRGAHGGLRRRVVVQPVATPEEIK
jgi:hypothetical protein